MAITGPNVVRIDTKLQIADDCAAQHKEGT